jgi:hypothetical protein
MNPLFLLGRALEFPNRELFSSYNGKMTMVKKYNANSLKR